MKNLPLIEVTELIKGIESSDNFQDDLSIADLNGDLINYEEKRLEHSTPMRLNALLMILVQEGTADISVDYIPYKIEKNTFITLMPAHIIQVSKVSKDLSGRLLIVSRSFWMDILPRQGKRTPWCIICRSVRIHVLRLAPRRLSIYPANSPSYGKR